MYQITRQVAFLSMLLINNAKLSRFASAIILMFSIFITFVSFSQEKVVADKRIKEIDTINDPVHDSIIYLLDDNIQILGQLLMLETKLREVSQSIRLQENYKLIQQQQNANEAIMQIRNSIKKKAYISLGVGLLSSAIFIASTGGGSENDYKGLRYAGVGISLSIPIYNLLTMRRQMDKLAPMQPIDYSNLQNPSYPITTASQDYFLQYFKAEVFYLQALHEALYIKLILARKQVHSNSVDKQYAESLVAQEYMANSMKENFMMELKAFHIKIGNVHALESVDHGTRGRLEELDQLIITHLDTWEKSKNRLFLNLEKLHKLIAN
jgi:hypothetical protein